MNQTRIHVLVFEGCPHLDLAVERVREAVTRLKVSADIQIVRVENTEQAKEFRFLGSPTVQVDGTDIELAAANRDDFAWCVFRCIRSALPCAFAQDSGGKAQRL